MPDFICNTSPLQYLHQIGRLEILAALTGRVIIPPAVLEELSEGRSAGFDVPEVQSLEWIAIRIPVSLPALPLAAGLGKGEAAVLALALEPGERRTSNVEVERGGRGRVTGGVNSNLEYRNPEGNTKFEEGKFEMRIHHRWREPRMTDGGINRGSGQWTRMKRDGLRKAEDGLTLRKGWSIFGPWVTC